MNPIHELNERLKIELTKRTIQFEWDEHESAALISDRIIAKGEYVRMGENGDPISVPVDPNNLDFFNDLLESATRLPAMNPMRISYPKEFLSHARHLIPGSIAKKECVFPIGHKGNLVHIALAVPTDPKKIRKMEYVTGSRIAPYCCHSKAIEEAIETYYGETEIGRTLGFEDEDALLGNAIDAINRLIIDNAEPERKFNHISVIRLLQYIMNKLVKQGASDIHFEPQADRLAIRSRVDGDLKIDFEKLPLNVGDVLVQRIKLISGMDVNNRAIPQDGSIDYNLFDEMEIDMRVSSLPSLHGEKIVTRILNTGSIRLKLTDLGLEKKDEENVNSMIHRPYGLILLTGPTGSGKTTTLYAMLNDLNKPKKSIFTVEDPIEYRLPGITQVNCDEKVGLTFNSVLRSFLRQDPDIIMVGEIRDEETADIAVKAAMTGHVVLSTLHTNDAPSAVERLINLNVQRHLVASKHVCIIAQRLLKKLCPDCKIPYTADAELLKRLKSLEFYDNEPSLEGKPIELYREAEKFKCPKCHNGFKGRIGIYEIFLMNDTIIKLLEQQAPMDQVKAEACRGGMKTLRQAALSKVLDGVTSVGEAMTITMEF